MNHLSADEIISRYKNGESDFSNTECKSGNFAGHRLKGIIFRNSDLEGASFSGCVLDDADFFHCNLQWINFDHASARRTDFTEADLQWAKATGPIFEKTLFIRANLNEAYIFEANMNETNLTDSIRDKLVTKFSEITDTDFMTADDELRRRGVSFDISLKISSGIKRMKQRWDGFVGVGKTKAETHDDYNDKTGYSKDSEGKTYNKSSYNKKESVYDTKVEYRKKERRK